MRGRIERFLMSRWYGGVAPGLVLGAVAELYGALMRLRRVLYRTGALRQQRLAVPVIVVGNRTVGGAGKTPLVIALVEALRERGWRPGVVSRGYGRRADGLALVDGASSTDVVGDEPLLIHLATGCPVAVDADRLRAAGALGDHGCDLLIADDGLQHLRLGRVVEIEVQDARGLGNGRVMPAGPLREPLPEQGAWACVVHGREPRGDEVPMRLVLGDPRPLDGWDARPLAAFAGRRVHAVAGIGHPPRFFSALREAGLEVDEHPFPDHHAFEARDFSDLRGSSILMTGKDAVKCRGLGLVDAWEVPVRALLPDVFLDALHQHLRDHPRHVDP